MELYTVCVFLLTFGDARGLGLCFECSSCTQVHAVLSNYAKYADPPLVGGHVTFLAKYDVKKSHGLNTRC